MGKSEQRSCVAHNDHIVKHTKNLSTMPLLPRGCPFAGHSWVYLLDSGSLPTVLPVLLHILAAHLRSSQEVSKPPKEKRQQLTNNRVGHSQYVYLVI